MHDSGELEKCMDNVKALKIYGCGTALPENAPGAYIDPNLKCSSPINVNYYKSSKCQGPIICYKCGDSWTMRVFKNTMQKHRRTRL